MAKTPFISGRAGSASVQIQVEGLYPFLKRAAAADPMFNKELRAASVEIAKKVVPEIRSHASYSPNRRQAIQSAMGFRAFSDRVPAIRLRGSSEFISKSRPNRTRRKKVTRGDVFFGSEFGASRLPQFPPRTAPFGGGNRGTYVWPTIEAMGPTIYAEYEKSIDRITRRLQSL
jgi:hypothetical protein